MCGRYSLKTNPLELQAALELDRVPDIQARFNIAPTQDAPIITALNPKALTIARWGLIPNWTQELRKISHTFNARSETLKQKGIFKDAFARRRALVPIDGFYEWKQVGKLKQPLHITLQSHRPFCLAGLWDTWRSPAGLEVISFSIVTTQANDFIRAIHQRMPVVIAPANRHTWLTDDAHAIDLLKPWNGEAMTALEVSQAVNKVAVDDPRCLEPAKSVQLPLV